MLCSLHCIKVPAGSVSNAPRQTTSLTNFSSFQTTTPSGLARPNIRRTEKLAPDQLPSSPLTTTASPATNSSFHTPQSDSWCIVQSCPMQDEPEEGGVFPTQECPHCKTEQAGSGHNAGECKSPLQHAERLTLAEMRDVSRSVPSSNHQRSENRRRPQADLSAFSRVPVRAQKYLAAVRKRTKESVSDRISGARSVVTHGKAQSFTRI